MSISPLSWKVSESIKKSLTSSAFSLLFLNISVSMWNLIDLNISNEWISRLVWLTCRCCGSRGFRCCWWWCREWWSACAPRLHPETQNLDDWIFSSSFPLLPFSFVMLKKEANLSEQPISTQSGESPSSWLDFPSLVFHFFVLE